MPVYSLYLNTTSANSTNTNGSSATWNVNFDQLFKSANYDYNKCRLRFNIIGRIPNGTIGFATSLGNISCTLPTNFNGSNLISPTLLNIFELRATTITNLRQTTPTKTNTADTPGVNIQVPKGSFPVTINFAKFTNFTELTDFGYSAGVFDYTIHFMFELYDPKI
jgi:hypothetical protein